MSVFSATTGIFKQHFGAFSSAIYFNENSFSPPKQLVLLLRAEDDLWGVHRSDMEASAGDDH